jgi:5-methylcytosine-specific restriction endonuclease McrA
MEIMKNKNIDAGQVWKDFEDLLAHQLDFSVIDRAVYSHLLRHSRLEGKVRFRFSITWLARGVGIAIRTARDAVRRLVARGVLDLVERNTQAHHVVRLRLPSEVRAVHTANIAAYGPDPAPLAAVNFEEDFLRTRALRLAIHAREDGSCFYCLRPITCRRWCIDHVVPRAQSGRNCYRNLVSCCVDCNAKKAERSAEEFFRSLYREHRLSDDELSSRLRALEDLAAGKLIPPLPVQRNTGNGRKEGS